ncbi:MAG: pyruvate carboxyltransferase [Firmicutes bacterium]|nr:pyruvate carboxyltransferase [Bacillota bacterium]
MSCVTKSCNKKSYRSGKWFVSDWNFSPEATSSFNFAENIVLHDVTLRDGEQQAGVCFKKDEKIRIADALVEAGIKRIEAGMPAVSRYDAEAITEIVKRHPDAEIFAFARCMKQDVKRAADCGVKGIVVEIPASEHVIKVAYQWPLEKAIDLSIEATAYAKELGLYTVFFPIDGTRSSLDWFLEIVTRVAREGHMDALVLVDTFGVCSPHGIAEFVRGVKSRIDKPLEAHFHNDFGLAVANTLVALAAGVDVAHVTVGGIGERAGNCNLEELVLGLLALYGQELPIDYSKLCSLAELVYGLAGIPMRGNQPVVGPRLYNIESGIITSWWENSKKVDPLEVVPFHWDVVGQNEPRVVLGKKSGLDSIRVYLQKMGRADLAEKLDDDKILEILMEVKERSIQTKKLISFEEFVEILHSFNILQA